MDKILLLEGIAAACSNINNQQREMTDPWRDKVMAVMSMSEITNSCIVNQLSLNIKIQVISSCTHPSGHWM